MFWGLIMEPHRRYSQVVKKSFHISMAALDISTSNEEPAQVMCGFEGRIYLLCTLKKPNMVQSALDLNFEAGTKVSFATNGKCHVHLTGYLTDDLDLSEDEEQVEEEENVEEEEEQVVNKSGKRNKSELNGPPKKKVKGEKDSSTQQIIDADESDSDDSDFNLSLALKKEEEVSEEESEGVIDEEDENDDNEDEEEEDDEEVSSLSDDDDDEEEEVEEEEETVVKPQKKAKMNGIAKKEGVTKKQINKEGKTTNKQQQEKDSKTPVKSPKNEQKQKTPAKEQSGKKSQKRVLQGGVSVEDIREGSGDLAKNGKFVHVYYEGRLKDSNKMFDSTLKGPGFGFRLGKGEVIKGWDIGVQGMKPGGKRRITCPPGMAYGNKGSPPVIPPNSTLVFDVELKRMS